MTTTPPPQPQPAPDREPISTAPLRRRKRIWIATALGIGVAILAPLVMLQTTARPGRAGGLSPEQRQQRQRLLELGAALKQYASANDNALPDQAPPSANPAAAGATYRVVTPSGERLRYEQFGDRVVAWTEPDAEGRRAVLLNSLDEVERVAAADLNLTEQRRADGSALNRVRIVSPEGEGEGEEESEPTTGPTTAPTEPTPATGPNEGD